MQYIKRISLLLTEYPHTNAHVHYIKTNNNAMFAVCLRVLLSGILVGYIPAKLPPLQRYNVTPDFHHLCKFGVYLCRVRVRVSCAVEVD